MHNSHKILTEQDDNVHSQHDSTPQISPEHFSAPKNQPNSEIKSNNQKVNFSPSNLIGLITHRIQNQIEQSQITISNEPKPFSLIDRSNDSTLLKNDSQKYDTNKVAEFIKKRKLLEEEIRRLKLEQQEQRNKSRSKSPFDKTHKTFRSNFTTKQHLEISRIIKKSQEFESQIQSKDKFIVQTLEADRIRQLQQQKIYLEKLKEKKKEEALKKIEKIKQEQKERTQKIKGQNKKFQQIKRIKALHQKIEEHDKLFEQQRKKKQSQFLKQKRQAMTFNFAQIKDHEKKYYDTVRMSKEKIQHQFLQKIQKMKQEQVLLSQTYRPSKFLLTLRNEQKQKEELQLQRIERLKSLYSKKNNYQEELRSIHKEKIKTRPKVDMKKSILDEKIEQHRLKVKSMSAADIYKQGQQYMKSIHKSITPNLIEQTKNEIQRNYSELRNAPKPQYKDYLQQQKMKKELQYKSTGKINPRENPEIHQLQSLIQRKQQNPNIKLQKAKLIAQKLDKKAKNSSTSALIDSISAKLKIIEEFS